MKNNKINRKIFYSFIFLIILINCCVLYIYIIKRNYSNFYIKKKTNFGSFENFYKYNDKAPSFVFNDEKNSVICSDSLKGKIVFIIFFNPEDLNHVEILTFINKLFLKNKDKNYKIIAISDDSIKTYVENLNDINFAIVIDDNLKIHNKFKIINGCGAMLLINKDGIIKFIKNFILDKKSTELLLKKHLE